MTAPIDAARAAWGEDLPDWVEALALECGRSSQAQVAKRLGRSTTVISQVVNRRYPATLSAIEERVRGVLMYGSVACPGLGEIPTHECQDWREKSRHFAFGNPVRVRMFRACNACPRNQMPRKETHE
jgi:hypothetical protein